jgi:hypothetical protein
MLQIEEIDLSLKPNREFAKILPNPVLSASRSEMFLDQSAATRSMSRV